MTRTYKNLPIGWKRVITIGHIGVLIYALNDSWSNPIPDKLFVVGIVSLEYWIAVLLIVWVVDGFKR
jgi:hypothetical protein